ncbi:MAG: hypothetical protein KKE50_00295 [Nanoarchaeota archaeon]|nr:hypothetical protein [Nanoarchaeota archaeon]
MSENEESFNEKLKEIVIMRINAISSNLRLSIGGGETMSKEEMIDHVKKEDETGRQILKSHLSFLKAVANGEFTKAISSV